MFAPTADPRVPLALDRPMTSLIDRDIAVVSGDLTRTFLDWTWVWVDRGRVVRDAGLRARRAIDDAGTLMWAVGEAAPYLSQEADPVAAIEEAQAAFARRAALAGAPWSARAMVTRADALAAGLSPRAVASLSRWLPRAVPAGLIAPVARDPRVRAVLAAATRRQTAPVTRGAVPARA